MPSARSRTSSGPWEAVPGDSHLGVTRVPASDDVAEGLDIPPATPVARIDRVRLIDGAPLAVACEFVILPKPDQDFDRIRTFKGGSLYKFLHDRCGMALSRSTVAITAVPADAARAKLLKVRRERRFFSFVSRISI